MAAAEKKQHHHQHYWVNEAQITELGKAVGGNVIAFPCADFRTKLLSLSKLNNASSFYTVLRKVMSRFLQFEKKTRPPPRRRYPPRRSDEKLRAVVAGSYPAYLGRALKRHADVDVFVLVKDSDMKTFNNLWKVMREDDSIGFDIEYGYQRVFKDILAIVNFGKVQLVFRYYSCECECDYHVDNTFFRDFHHCTRWKLDVFENFVVPRYIHLEEGGGGIICKETSLTARYEKMVILNREGVFEAFKHPKKYPIKHLKNVIDFGPPTLKQQSLHRLLRSKTIEEEKPIENVVVASCCSRKRKRSSSIITQEAIDMDLLMCSEEMEEDEFDEVLV